MCVWCCWGTETLCLKSNGAVPHQLPQCRSIYAKLSWQSLLSINTTLLVQRFISFWTITIDGPSLHRLRSFFFSFLFFFDFSTLSSVHILHGNNGIFLFFFAVFMVRQCYDLDLPMKCCGMMEMTTFWTSNSVTKRRAGLFISSHGRREQNDFSLNAGHTLCNMQQESSKKHPNRYRCLPLCSWPEMQSNRLSNSIAFSLFTTNCGFTHDIIAICLETETFKSAECQIKLMSIVL